MKLPNLKNLVKRRENGKLEFVGLTGKEWALDCGALLVLYAFLIVFFTVLLIISQEIRNSGTTVCTSIVPNFTLTPRRCSLQAIVTRSHGDVLRFGRGRACTCSLPFYIHHGMCLTNLTPAHMSSLLLFGTVHSPHASRRTARETRFRPAHRR